MTNIIMVSYPECLTARLELLVHSLFLTEVQMPHAVVTAILGVINVISCCRRPSGSQHSNAGRNGSGGEGGTSSQGSAARLSPALSWRIKAKAALAARVSRELIRQFISIILACVLHWQQRITKPAPELSGRIRAKAALAARVSCELIRHS